MYPWNVAKREYLGLDVNNPSCVTTRKVYCVQCYPGGKQFCLENARDVSIDGLHDPSPLLCFLPIEWNMPLNDKICLKGLIILWGYTWST
jgi:hypothetical protein